jgi:hypothetical protein
MPLNGNKKNRCRGGWIVAHKIDYDSRTAVLILEIKPPFFF